MKTQNATHKVFVGLRPRQSAAVAIAAWRESHSGLDMRWLRDEDLHVTILPPWEEDDIESAVRTLESIAGAPVEIRFNEIGWGSTEFWPNLIWITGEDDDGFKLLRKSVESAFGRKANDPFLPHVTVARIPKERQAKEMPDIREPFGQRGIADELVLFESLGYSRYEPLASVKLA